MAPCQNGCSPSFSTSPVKKAGPTAKVKETAAPNQIAAFMMPMKRITRITASRYAKQTARAKRETREVRSEVRSQRSEVSGQRSEVGGQKSEVGHPRSSLLISDL